MADVVLWDSCVIIDAIQKTQEEDRYAKIEPFVCEAQQGKIKIVVSEISVAEVTGLNSFQETTLTENQVKEHQRLIVEWFENPYIIRRPVVPGISELARDIGFQYGLAGLDRIIVATACFYKIPTIHTFDGAGKKKKNKMIALSGQVGNPPVTIMEPDPDYGTLFQFKNKEQKNR